MVKVQISDDYVIHVMLLWSFIFRAPLVAPIMCHCFSSLSQKMFLEWKCKYICWKKFFFALNWKMIRDECKAFLFVTPIGLYVACNDW
ncbi:hypothetical protein XELAEV_18030831mg [Xenopus laevis]|uniref:Uncharacterized protein n=1 Tax=Xenopus laevis TaxID=8355 RepID=A0A974HF37_XENLA|nr:hypothetical protein XELAEV_18030831mg [Xenopus laevis]